MQENQLVDPEEKKVAAERRLSDILSLRDIALYVADTAYSRGKSYQRQQRVSNLAVSPDLSSISGIVQGSASEPYEVSVTLTPLANSRAHISGTCTCPQSHNCKHVAAVLLEALAEEQQPMLIPPPELRVVPAPVAQAPLPFDVSQWLEQLEFSANGDVFSKDLNQRLLYLIQSYTSPNAFPHLAVEIVNARLLKDGQFSNSVTRPLLYNFSSGNWPRHFRPSDIQICQAVQNSRTISQSYKVETLEILKIIVATGRAYWQSQANASLTMGEPRPGHIEWAMQDSRGLRPVLRVESAIALNAEPPVYVDTDTNVVGEISLPLSAPIAYRLINAPAISLGLIEQVGRSLSKYLPPGSDLIPKPPPPAISVDTEPRPVVRLLVHPSGSNGATVGVEMPLARLTFHYGPVAVPVGEIKPIIEALVGSQLYRARRMPTREREIIARLFAVDFRFAREIYTLVGVRNEHDLAFADPYSWLEFLSQDVPELEAEGFEIIIDSDFPYRLAKPSGEIDAEIVEGNRIDWFELGMGVQVDGQKLDLAPILANLVLDEQLDTAKIQAMAEEGENLFIPLDDGRHLALAVRRYLPLIIALHELTMGGSMVARNGRIQISKAEAALLAGLTGQEGIAFTGIENLRHLARSFQEQSTGGLKTLALPENFRAILRPYQAEGLAWLNLLRDAGLGGVLADDMGLGKTIQILALLSVEKAEGRLVEPALIIAPTSLMTNWQNEARRFAPDLRVLLLHGSDRKERFDQIAGHDVVLTTYPLIARDQAVLLDRHWHMAILDEAQVIKNPNAATTKLIRDLKCSHRFCLTGTPMENHLGELWSLMSFVNPGYLGDKTNFARRWRNPIEKHSDTERSRTLARRVKPFLLRRTKQAVAGELPPKTEITEAIVLDDQQRDVYDSIRLSMHKKVRSAIAAKGLAKSHIIILEALLKLRQVCCDPRLLKLSTGRPAPSAKLERLMEMVEELLEEGRKIIVFSQFTSMLELVTQRFQAAGIAYSLLTGDTRDRKTAIDSFQLGEVSVFLVSLKAGGVGLNLTAADTVILYDPWWNPAVEEQAIDRAYRIGQDKPVFVYRLVASQTIEEKMDELKAKKRALAQSVFDATGNPTTALTEADLDNLFED